MTFSATSGKTTYDGDNSTVAFPTVFKFVLNAHVKVILRDAADLETTWVEGTEYTLAGAGAELGGTVTATTAPLTGEVLTVILDVTFTQGKSLPLGGAFPSTQVEEALDLLAMGLAKLNEVDNRTFKVPETDSQSGSQLDIPIDSVRASKFLAFDALGQAIAAAGTSADLTPVSAYINNLLDDVDAATARGTLDAQEDVINTRGDVVVGNATPAAARLALGAVKSYLRSDGTDALWSLLLGSDISVTTLDNAIDFTFGATDHNNTLTGDATSGQVTGTLPALASAVDGYTTTLVRKDATAANLVRLKGNAAETISAPGGARNIVNMPSQFARVTVRKVDGAWYVVDHHLTFESTNQTITSAGLLTLAHGLGVEPKFVELVLENQTAEHNYSTGDRILVNSNSSDAVTSRIQAVIIDATNVSIRFSNAAACFTIANKTTGVNVAATNANWELIVRAFL